MNLDPARCPYLLECSGCEPDEAALRRDRTEARLRQAGLAIPATEWVSLAAGGLRDRLDFSLSDGRFGLYDRGRGAILDLNSCAQLSPALAAWCEDFRANLPPLRRASIRLRVAPDGLRGLWIDAANVDIKALLDQQEWLAQNLRDEVVIELGQRRKRVVDQKGPLRLGDPDPQVWSETVFRDEILPLRGLVGGFTQPGHQTNQWITAKIRDWVMELNPRSILEFGSGAGNLTFPALSSGAKLLACEIEASAVEALRLNAAEWSRRHPQLADRLLIETKDWRRPQAAFPAAADLLLMNPARSGVGGFLDPLTEDQAVQAAIMMSCHIDSFVVDAVRLHGAGFRIEKLKFLDQFPATGHVELLSKWIR